MVFKRKSRRLEFVTATIVNLLYPGWGSKYEAQTRAVCAGRLRCLVNYGRSRYNIG
jgi:hypothetical protein